jgi:eukaryotic-like serine/threonine-protein kinase
VANFGKYELISRINIGGMAEIVKARDLNSPGQPVVAVKRILPHLCADQQYKTMFLDESRVLAQLQHEDIIKTFEIGEVDETPYIALEYIDGQDARMLFHKTRKSGEHIPVAIACFIIGKLCDGLHHAHEQKDAEGALLGLVHRDVSLQNVLLSYAGDVKVTDFGIAMSAENVARTEVGIVKGKFGYMSPEQIKGAPLDRRSDVFAAGICLHELLTGERLFSGESDYKAVERVRNVDIPTPSSLNRMVPSNLERIVLKALAKHPRDRYQTAQDMSRALATFVAESKNASSKADLGAYLRKVFADEIVSGEALGASPTPTPGAVKPAPAPRKDPTPAPAPAPRAPTPAPAPQAPTRTMSGLAAPVPYANPAAAAARQDGGRIEARPEVLDAPTGLAAFDDLEAPSALNVMPEPPAPLPPPPLAAPVRRVTAPMQVRISAPVSRPSVPPLIPRAESIPGFTPSTAGAVSSPAGLPAASTADIDWDEDEPRTQSLGLDEVPMLAEPGHHGEPGDDDVTRQVRIDDTFAGLQAVPTGEFPPTLDERPPVTLDEHLASGPPATRYARSQSHAPPAPRSYVLIIAIVVGLIVIIASALYTFRKPGVASLQLTTDPRDAVVTVNGTRVASSSSPFVVDGLEIGRDHVVAVSKDGYKTWSTTIAVHGDKGLTLPTVVLDKQISAMPEPPPAALEPAPTPAAEAPKPKKAAAAPAPAAPSAPKVAVKDRATTPSAPSPKRERPVAAATAAPGGKGTLRINTRPWSQVFVNGKMVGNTPQMNIPLPAGTHKVRLVNPDFKLTKTITVQIVAGKTVTQVITLQ